MSLYSPMEFTRQEKMPILKEAKFNGVMLTLSKYDLDPDTYYYWKKRFSLSGEYGLYYRVLKDLDKENKRLEKENERLKRIIGEKEFESALKV